MNPAALAESEAMGAEAAEEAMIPPAPGGGLETLADVPLTVAFELARCTITAGELLALGPGSVVNLGVIDVDSVLVMVEGDAIGSGEVTLCEDRYGIRVTHLGDRGPGEAP